MGLIWQRFIIEEFFNQFTFHLCALVNEVEFNFSAKKRKVFSLRSFAFLFLELLSINLVAISNGT